MHTSQDGTLLLVDTHGSSDLLYDVYEMPSFERWIRLGRLGAVIVNFLAVVDAITVGRSTTYFPCYIKYNKFTISISGRHIDLRVVATYHSITLPNNNVSCVLDRLDMTGQELLDLFCPVPADQRDFSRNVIGIYDCSRELSSIVADPMVGIPDVLSSIATRSSDFIVGPILIPIGF